MDEILAYWMASVEAREAGRIKDALVVDIAASIEDADAIAHAHRIAVRSS